MSKQALGMFDMFDQAIANDLEVTVQEYISKIESVDEDVMETILMNVFNGDITTAKELFNGI